MKRTFWAPILTLSAFLALSLVSPALHSASLGIGVKPVPKVVLGDDAKLTENSNLWFVVKQGEELSRQIILTGSTIDQRVMLDIVAAINDNGTLAPSNSRSEVTKFANFSDNDFILKANQNKVLTLTLKIPEQAQSQAFNAYLSVTVGSENEIPKSNATKNKVQAIVKNQIRTLLRVFVGIGSYKDFFTDLQIEDVKDYSIAGAKFVDVVIKNTGRTPITPSGEVSFSSLDFAGLRFGPISYLTLTMEPGVTSKFKMRVPDEIEPGNWQILVKAQQGDILRTRIFEKNLKFREGIDWLGTALRLIAAILSLLIFYYLRRNYSLSRKSESESTEVVAKRNFFSYLRLRVGSARGSRKKKSIPDPGFSERFEKLLQEIDLEAATKKAATKKAATKKAATKKAATKKAATKKAATKKAATKKAK